MSPTVVDVPTDNVRYVPHVGAPLMLYPRQKNSSHSADNVAPAACGNSNSPTPSLDSLNTEVNPSSPQHLAQPGGSTSTTTNKRH
eukprot:2844549-Ditylum_brightwellii.AAC.1